MIKSVFIFSLILTGTILSRADSPNTYATIGRPSIFWREGEWQVFQDGRWIPYAATRPASAVEPQNNPEPAIAPEPEIVETNGVYYGGGYWGYGFPVFSKGHRHHSDKEHLKKRETRSLTDSAVGGIGRTTIGIGRQSGGLAKRPLVSDSLMLAGPNHSWHRTTEHWFRPNYDRDWSAKLPDRTTECRDWRTQWTTWKDHHRNRPGAGQYRATDDRNGQTEIRKAPSSREAPNRRFKVRVPFCRDSRIGENVGEISSIFFPLNCFELL